MRIPRTWVAVGTAAVLGAGATTTAAMALNDRDELGAEGGAITLSSTQGDDATGSVAGGAVDDSPESADSPNASAVESTNSPFDSPDDPDYVDPSPESADSPNASAADSPVDSPADAPAVAPAAASADSPADSPAQAPVRAPAPAPAADSPDEPAPAADSPADSPADSDSPASADSPS